MIDFDIQELQLVVFLCMQRKAVVGIEACEKEGTADLYRKACAIIRDYTDE
jgi:hypothetical protein